MTTVKDAVLSKLKSTGNYKAIPSFESEVAYQHSDSIILIRDTNDEAWDSGLAQFLQSHTEWHNTRDGFFSILDTIK